MLEILKLMLSRDSDQDLCLTFCCDLNKLLWCAEFNPWVRCAFDNIWVMVILIQTVGLNLSVDVHLSLNPLSDKPNLLSLLNAHCAANRTDSQQTVPIVSSFDLVDRPWTPLRIDYVAFSRTAERCRTLRPWWWCPICPLPSTYASLDWEPLSLSSIRFAKRYINT